MKAASSRIMDDVVMNRTEQGCSVWGLFQYIEEQMDSWLGLPVIWDLRDFNFDALQDEDFSTYLMRARAMAAKRTGMKTAVIVNSDHAFPMIRDFMEMIEKNLGIKLRVFRSLSEAARWVGVQHSARKIN